MKQTFECQARNGKKFVSGAHGVSEGLERRSVLIAIIATSYGKKVRLSARLSQNGGFLPNELLNERPLANQQRCLRRYPRFRAVLPMRGLRIAETAVQAHPRGPTGLFALRDELLRRESFTNQLRLPILPSVSDRKVPRGWLARSTRRPWDWQTVACQKCQTRSRRHARSSSDRSFA